VFATRAGVSFMHNKERTSTCTAHAWRHVASRAQPVHGIRRQRLHSHYMEACNSTSAAHAWSCPSHDTHTIPAGGSATSTQGFLLHPDASAVVSALEHKGTSVVLLGEHASPDAIADRLRSVGLTKLATNAMVTRAKSPHDGGSPVPLAPAMEAGAVLRDLRAKTGQPASRTAVVATSALRARAFASAGVCATAVARAGLGVSTLSQLLSMFENASLDAHGF